MNSEPCTNDAKKTYKNFMYYTYYYHKQITKWHKKNHTEEKFHKKSFDNLMTKKRYCNAWNDI